jgi:hypothetical protein
MKSNPFLPSGGPPSGSSEGSSNSDIGGNWGPGGRNPGTPNPPNLPRISAELNHPPLKDKTITLNTSDIKIKWSNLPEYDGTHSKALKYILDIMSLSEISDSMSSLLGVALPR